MTATLHVQCPECDVVVPIAVQAELTELSDRRQGISLDPDLTELWAHAWTHDPES
ncbi:hypothetical protein ABTX80_22600 [Streptomyces erythrochromogenes]|uniref:hypothetical protein n=1 Tax=Streptomyces erythrochromogenes TaxID=285574 RepID=UPI0033237C9B